ncbi:potassium transporter [Lepidopterella palustris CBS 459.81]|uniref:Potassium transporter n=1 Tax=Lepidopterella palustris CBS 459.81 TaxID=1314670 RepID=A0A8E2JAH8_9PEZI|nr:potassium transporter [Lepidopterella palustris CBS 459.81]
METTIQFSSDLKPTRSNVSHSNSIGIGGVYAMRSRSSLHDRRSSIERPHEKTLPADEDSGLRAEGDYKKKQVFSTRQLLLLAYQSIGVIYGDIGTSPLYVYSSTFSSAPSYDDLLGALSIVIWSLTFMVTIKYVLVILRADNEGEGGTFSTYALLSRFANISNRDPREASMVRMQRYLSKELGRAGVSVRSTIERSKLLRGLLKTIGVLAVSMVLSDGILTPAQSVLGAVQGLDVVVHDISKSTIVGTTCGILILLFVVQPLGISKITVVFSPIIIIWLAFNAVFGIYNLVKHDHSVLKAFSPVFAFKYLIRNKTDGWRSLGGILLAFTGVEALFADLGAFSRRAIQLSWLCWTFPCLLLAYIGQAAFISVHPEAYSNPFFKTAPQGTVVPALVIAVLAAIVASQAIITATFQLMTQIMRLSYFPQVKVVHTSKTYHGQVYVPLVNWLVMIGTVLVAAIFNNTTSLGNAYGVCVMFVTFFDTCMVTLAAILVWKLNPYLVFLPWLIILCLDGTFLSSALTKVPNGAWFTLTLAAVLASIFILWRFGKEQQWQAEAEDRFPTSHFVQKREDGRLMLTQRFGATSLSSIQGFGIFFDKAGETTPIVFSQFVRKLVTVPEVVVFFHLRPIETPSVPPESRYYVSRLAIPNCYRLIVRHGYMDEVISPDLASLIFDKIRDHIIRHELDQEGSVAAITGAEPAKPGAVAKATSDNSSEQKGCITSTHDKESVAPSTTAASPSNVETTRTTRESSIAASLAILQLAFDHEVLYIIGKEQMRVKAGTRILRRALLKAFLFLRENTRTKIANLNVQRDRVIEIGFVKDV